MSFNISKMKYLRVESQEFKDLKEDKKIYVYLNFIFKKYRNKPIEDIYTLKRIYHEIKNLAVNYEAINRDWFNLMCGFGYTLETGRIYGFQEILIYNMKHKDFIDFIIKMYNEISLKRETDIDIGYYVPGYLLNNLKEEV